MIVARECRDVGGGDRPYLSTVKVRKRGRMVLIRKRRLTREYVQTVGFGW